MKNFFDENQTANNNHYLLSGEKNPPLFKIPNPFDEAAPDKKSWFLKLRRLQKQAEYTRKKLEEILKRQEDTEKGLSYIQSYCSNLPKNRYKNRLSD